MSTIKTINGIRIEETIVTDVAMDDRIIEDHQTVLAVVEYFRSLGKKIVYTMGTYDLKHVGHERYLRKARESGGLLIAGCDSDEYVRKEKGPDRPTVPYTERSESLTHTRWVNIVTVLGTHDANINFVELIHPDVVVLSFSSAKDDFEAYEKRMKEKYGPYCGEVVILPRQAETSTSAILRLIVVNGSKKVLEVVERCAEMLRSAWSEFITSNGGAS